MDRFGQDVLKADYSQFDQIRPEMGPGRMMPSVDADGYPFEPISSFSTDPIGFEESALTLLAEAQEIFWISRILNRHTPKYMKVCRDLENVIRELGSFCVTKAVMEQKGCFHPALDKLEVTMLAMMASFNFRKCHSAFMESVDRGLFYGEKAEMVCRWNALVKRLHATAERITAIRDGKESVSLEKRQPAGLNPCGQEKASSGEPEAVRPFRDGAASLPADKAAVRRMTADREAGTEASGAGVNAAPVSAAPSRSLPESGENAGIPLMQDEDFSDGFDDEDDDEEDIPFVSDGMIARMQALYHTGRVRQPVPVSAEDPSFRPAGAFRPPPVFRPEGF